MLPPFDPWLSGAIAADVAAASHANADALAVRRARRLAQLLASAARRSRLYRRRLVGRDPSSLRLQDLPIMRKADSMRHFDDWVTDPELRLGGHFASTVSMERLRRLNPALSGGLHVVSFLQPTYQLVAELQALAPTIIATYPSAAVLLAEERVVGRLKVAPQEIWTGGETLSPAMRWFVQQAFGCPVVERQVSRSRGLGPTPAPRGNSSGRRRDTPSAPRNVARCGSPQR